jgi:SAM-dependent methyltransferase
MDLRARVQGTLGVLRSGNATARALSVADSRSFVRSQFLAAAVRVDLLPFLRTERSVDEIAAHLGSRRPDRLAAFLAVGVELGELRAVDGAYRARGRRARAIANGDVLLTAHYRSMLDYQTSPYARLTDLLRADEGDGLSDLDQHATVIADVSLAAAPFVTPLLERVVTELRPSRALDVGCGTGVYTASLLDADASVRVDGIDLAPDVVEGCRERLGPARAARVELHVGDVRTWTPPADRRYDLVTLVNDVYYFAPAERVALYRRLRELLTPSGELVVVTMLWPGSIASAHLHWMLVAQAGAAALPGRTELDANLRAAGFTRVVVDDLVPTEPFVGIRAGA